LITDWIW